MDYLYKVIIGVCVLVLLSVGYVRISRTIDSFSKKDQISEEAEEEAFSNFFNKEDPDAPQGERPQVSLPVPDAGPAKVTSDSFVRPVLNRADAELTTDSVAASFEKLEQKFTKYYNNPAMQAFNEDIQKVMDNVTFEDMVSPDFQTKYLSDPKVQQILLQYSKDPAFMGLMQEMMSDSAFMMDAGKKINNPQQTNTNNK